MCSLNWSTLDISSVSKHFHRLNFLVKLKFEHITTICNSASAITDSSCNVYRIKTITGQEVKYFEWFVILTFCGVDGIEEVCNTTGIVESWLVTFSR